MLVPSQPGIQWYPLSSEISENYNRFSLFEIHIVTLKAFPTEEFRSKYTVPPLKKTTDILWHFSRSCCVPFFFDVNKFQLSDCSLD